MRAELRHVMSPDIADLASWRPESEDFAVGISLSVGPQGSPGEELFDVTLCTAGWLAERARAEGVVDVRHHLVVANYDWSRVEDFLRQRIERCDGSTWDEIALKVSRLGYWEFEDYDNN